MSEAHLSEVERTLLYISEARDRAERSAQDLRSAGAEAHLVRALEDSARALADEHRRLMQRTFFAVPDSQDRLAV